MNTLWWQSSLKRGSSGVMWLKFLWNWNGFKTINQREDTQPGGFFTNLLRNGVNKMLPMPVCCFIWSYKLVQSLYDCVQNSTTKNRIKAGCTVNEISTSNIHLASHQLNKSPTHHYERLLTIEPIGFFWVCQRQIVIRWWLLFHQRH